MVFYIHTNILIIMLHYVFKNSENIYIYIYVPLHNSKGYH